MKQLKKLKKKEHKKRLAISKFLTTLNFQNLWVANSISNFDYLFKTPNLLMIGKDTFKGKKAIITGAGPSLNFEFDTLKRIKEDGSIYIFSAGSSIDALLNVGIKPDAFLSYDPCLENWKVAEKLINNNINDIPLIFGSTVGIGMLEKYKGDLYHAITSQDITSQYFLKALNDDEIPMIHDAPTIVAITMQILIYLGFSEIVFVGQDLSYGNGETMYANGIDDAGDRTLKLNEKQKQHLIKVQGNNGAVYTGGGFESMRMFIEKLIEANKQVKWINTTCKGAKINGAKYICLAEWYDSCKNEEKQKPLNEALKASKDFVYDKKHMMNKFEKFVAEFAELPDIIDELSAACKTEFCESKPENLADAIQKLFANDVWNVYFSSFFRLQRQQLEAAIAKCKQMKTPFERAENLSRLFLEYLAFFDGEYKLLDVWCKELAKQIYTIYNLSDNTITGIISRLVLCSGNLSGALNFQKAFKDAESFYKSLLFVEKTA